MLRPIPLPPTWVLLIDSPHGVRAYRETAFTVKQAVRQLREYLSLYTETRSWAWWPVRAYSEAEWARLDTGIHPR